MRNSLETIAKLKAENKQLKETSFLLRQIIDSVDANIYWKDKELRIIGVNKRNLKILQCDSVDDVLGRTDVEISEFFRSKNQNVVDIAKKLQANDELVLENGSALEFEEKETSNTIEKNVVYLTKKNILKDENGNIIGLVGISIDITERKQLQEKIEQQNQLKSKLIQAFQHNVYLPLNALDTNSQLLFMKLNSNDTNIDNKKINEVLDSFQRNINNLKTMITSLSQSLIESEEQVYNVPFNFRTLLMEEIAIASDALQGRKEVIFSYNIDDKIPIYINNDFSKIQNILRALLSNAVKFTESGLITFKVKLLSHDQRQCLVEFTIGDTGIGLDEKQKGYIFDLLKKAHNDVRFSGLGVGLYLVKRNLKLLNGTIKFESKLGQGSQFFVTLPLNGKVMKDRKKQAKNLEKFT